jgi:hypothetical protein
MRRVLQASLSLLVWAAWVPTAFGFLRPSFDLDDCGWHATHIVVVTEGEKIDGKVTVLESWRGNLRKGDRLDLPDLAEFANLDSRTISGPPFGGKPKPDEPKHVTGSRMILFLTWKPAETDPSKGSWMAASRWGGPVCSGSTLAPVSLSSLNGPNGRCKSEWSTWTGCVRTSPGSPPCPTPGNVQMPYGHSLRPTWTQLGSPPFGPLPDAASRPCLLSVKCSRTFPCRAIIRMSMLIQGWGGGDSARVAQ